MKSNVSVLIFFIACAFTCSFSNDSNLGSEAGSVFPVKHNSIQMVKEVIDVIVRKDSISVTCMFWFFNHGKKDTVLMGFPALICDEGDVEPIRNFTTEIDGNEIPTNYIENPKDNYCETCSQSRIWHTWSYLSLPGDTFIVKNRYTGDFGTNVIGTVFTNYIIGTGNTWYKNIAEGKVTFHHDKFASSLFRINPDKKSYNAKQIHVNEYEDSVVYTFTNFKPDCDQTLGVELIGFQHAQYDRMILDETLKNAIREKNMNIDELRKMRNEIFARHGYIFKDSLLNNFFGKRKWYKPDPAFLPSSLSSFEKELINFIQVLEKK